jgi:hypothetical protein
MGSVTNSARSDKKLQVIGKSFGRALGAGVLLLAVLALIQQDYLLVVCRICP